MKISKTALMVLGMGILIIAGVVLYLAYSQYVSQRDALALTINAANQKYSQVTSDKRALEPQLAQLLQKNEELKSAFDAAKGKFPFAAVQSIENEEELSKLAEDSAVKVQILTATDSSKRVDGNLTYLITDFTADVTGDRFNILDFLHRVAMSSKFVSATINSVNLKMEPTPTPGAPDAPPPVNFSTFSVSITIYRYEGN
jgi:outer membrane murein-binding lipoprotein Lpp